MSARCVWCSKDSGTLNEISAPMVNRYGGAPMERMFWVHPEHEGPFRRFAIDVNRNATRFILALVGTGLGMLVAATICVVTDNEAVAIAGVVGGPIIASILMIRWPFATPETVDAIGIRSSIIAVRIVACVFLALVAVVIGFAWRAS